MGTPNPTNMDAMVVDGEGGADMVEVDTTGVDLAVAVEATDVVDTTGNLST